jgi:hypothetical protein
MPQLFSPSCTRLLREGKIRKPFAGFLDSPSHIPFIFPAERAEICSSTDPFKAKNWLYDLFDCLLHMSRRFRFGKWIVLLDNQNTPLPERRMGRQERGRG